MVHEGVRVFKDSSGWYLLIFSKCANMKDGKCGIYEKRPYTCREHSAKDCEQSRGLNAGTERYFEDTAQFEDYCRNKFKSWDKRFE
jgi:Fe-S-cluster containining protein